jgi:hypothetical protein
VEKVVVDENRPSRRTSRTLLVYREAAKRRMAAASALARDNTHPSQLVRVSFDPTCSDMSAQPGLKMSARRFHLWLDTQEDSACPVIPLCHPTPWTCRCCRCADVVVFPHMVIPLFVGRPKSIKAWNSRWRPSAGSMLVAQKAAAKDEPSVADMFEVGCVSTILQMLKLPTAP